MTRKHRLLDYSRYIFYSSSGSGATALSHTRCSTIAVPHCSVTTVVQWTWATVEGVRGYRVTSGDSGQDRDRSDSGDSG
jgi:hypothetical protein